MHLHEDLTDGFREPALTADLKPAQMPTPVGRYEDSIGVLLELFVWNGFVR